MRAIVLHGVKDLKFHSDYPEPQLQSPTDVKIKVDYCGICGSDLHEYLDGPIFFKNKRNEISNKENIQCMGHEMCGEIVELGAKVNPEYKVGQKVVVAPTGTCLDRPRFPDAPNAKKQPCNACSEGSYNACDYIAFTGLGFEDGGFGDYCVVGDNHIVPYPPSVIPVDVAALIEPLAVAWHAVRIAKLNEGELALVLGAGPIGLVMILALKAHKAGNIVVSEPAEARRKLAESFGVQTFDPTNYESVDQSVTALKKLTNDGFGFHHSFDCSGILVSFEVSLKALRTTGVATNVAIWPEKPVDYFPMEITLHERTINGSMCHTREDFVNVVKAFEAKLVDIDQVRTLITGIVSVEDGIEKGFNELINHKEKHIKILVSPRYAN